MCLCACVSGVAEGVEPAVPEGFRVDFIPQWVSSCLCWSWSVTGCSLQLWVCCPAGTSLHTNHTVWSYLLFSLSNSFSSSVNEMITTFSMSTYKVGLKVNPNEQDQRVPVLIWSTCAYTIQSIGIFLEGSFLNWNGEIMESLFMSQTRYEVTVKPNSALLVWEGFFLLQFLSCGGCFCLKDSLLSEEWRQSTL